MSALADELHSVLTAFRAEVGTWTNQGLGVSIDGHLAQIEAAAADIARSADDEVHRILTDLYTAFHAPAPAPAAPVDSAAPVPPAAAETPAVGGPVTGPGPVLVSETGPETVVLPTGTAVTGMAPPVGDPAAAPAATETTPAAPADEPPATSAPAEDPAPTATPGS